MFPQIIESTRDVIPSMFPITMKKVFIDIEVTNHNTTPLVMDEHFPILSLHINGFDVCEIMINEG